MTRNFFCTTKEDGADGKARTNLFDRFAKRAFLALLHVTRKDKRLILLNVRESAKFKEFMNNTDDQKFKRRFPGSLFLVDMQGYAITQRPSTARLPPEKQWLPLLINALFINGAFEQLSDEKWLPMFREWLMVGAKAKMSLFEKNIYDAKSRAAYKRSKAREAFLQAQR